MNIRNRVWRIVEVAETGDIISRIFDVSILLLILLNVISVVIGSIGSIQQKFGSFLNVFEAVSVAIFTLEYIARIWSCTVDSQFNGTILGRFKFAFKFMSIIDILAILPFYLPFCGLDLRSLRALRLLRIFRIAKVGRYYSSLNLMKRIFQNKKEELLLTSAIMCILLVVSSSLLYYCENSAQPEMFSSIPATMWWAVTALTTVGYGDMYPVTVLGKIFASIIAILGIGMFALPTGIISSGFLEAMQERKNVVRFCPHCDKEI